MSIYYNEIHPGKAAAIRELVKHGIIAPGEVDERSVEDVRPSDLEGFDQCHFFAGIGVWSYALRLAGWPDDRPVWTGSCPCQPFSAAGKGEGFADERHLWPSFFHLTRVRRPVVVFGEQVSSKDGLAWFNHVRSDLEGEGYTMGVSDTCAAGFGAPHIRQRLYFVADAEHSERGALSIHGENERDRDDAGREKTHGVAGTRREVCLMADTSVAKRKRVLQEQDGKSRISGEGSKTGGCCDAGVLARASRAGLPEQSRRRIEPTGSPETNGPCNGFWSDAEWIPCRDGKMRPIEPGTFPLAHGAAARVLRLHCYGDCIVAPQAEAFVRAYMELERHWRERKKGAG